MSDEKKRRIVYKSEGNDDLKTVCYTVENAVHMFRTECETIIDGQVNDIGVELSVVEMTDAEVTAINEE